MYFCLFDKRITIRNVHNNILNNSVNSKVKKLIIKGITDKNNNDLNKKFIFLPLICDENKSEKKIFKA